MFNNPLIPLYLFLGQPLPRPARLYDYVIAAQGIVKRLETQYVSADQLLASIDTPLTGLRLAAYPLQPVRFKLPRIPGHLLREALTDARRNIDLEFMYQFRFDPVTNHWTVTRPEQDQSRTHVGYTFDPAGIVVDCHSHNVMPAFFSPTDDRDELGGRFYAVMGHLERKNPELILRLGFYGHWLYNVPALTIFDDLTPFEEIYLDTVGLAPVGDPEPPAARHGWLTHLFQWRTQ
jgi:PRTRC genetic system protein A